MAAYVRYKGPDDLKRGRAIELNALPTGFSRSDYYRLDSAPGSFLDEKAKADGWGDDDIESPYYENIVGNVEDKEKHVRLQKKSGDTKGDVAEWYAYPLEPSFYETLDAIDSEDFSDLTLDGDTVEGRAAIGIFNIDDYAATGKFSGGEGDAIVTVRMTIKDGSLVDLEACPADDSFLFCLETLDGSADGGSEVSDSSYVVFAAGNDKMLETTGESTYDFAAVGPDTLIKWAREGKGDTDTNGFSFRMGYDQGGWVIDPDTLEESMVFTDPESLTLDDIFIDPEVRYGDFRTLGDINETVRTFRQYQLSMNDSTDNKIAANDRSFVPSPSTSGLPRWLYEFYHPVKSEEQEDAELRLQQEIWDEVGADNDISMKGSCESVVFFYQKSGPLVPAVLTEQDRRGGAPASLSRPLGRDGCCSVLRSRLAIV